MTGGHHVPRFIGTLASETIHMFGRQVREQGRARSSGRDLIRGEDPMTSASKGLIRQSGAELSALWGTCVVELPERHGMLAYEPRPRSTLEMLIGTERWRDRTYLVQGHRRISFAQFLEALRAAAVRLSAKGARPGDRVLIHGYNSPEYALLIWAAWWAGSVPVLGNRWWSPQELRHAVRLVRPALLVTDLHAETLMLEMPVFDIKSFAACFEPRVLANASPEPNYPSLEEAPALVLFTSGSSGPPKGVVLSHQSVVANLHNLLLRSHKLPQTLNADADQEVMLTSTPMFHIGGPTHIITQLLLGGRLVLTEGRFDARQILELIEAEKVHRWVGVPTTAARVLDHPDFEFRNLSSLRSFPVGGAPVPEALLDKMRRKLPQLAERGLANTYGLTESGGFVTLATNKDLARYPDTIGRPYPITQLRIDEPDSKGVGEILVRAPTVMLGYLGEEDDGTVDGEGWLHTGDLGRMNDEGFLFIVGRLKDIVIRGGENIACAHVEQALLSHPDILEAAVFGVPHPDLGEELVAAVRHRPDAQLTVAQLREFLCPKLAGFAIPSKWRIGSSTLPTLPGGKINKQALRESFREHTTSAEEFP